MVYIIDDDQSVREGFAILLKSADFECRSIDSAEAFLAAWLPGEHDFLILDMHMPGMNGCELLAQLAEKGLYLPVIIITAYDEDSSRECAKNYGALAYLRKPVDGEALIDLIKYEFNPI
jgi:FixJ family two-component response regulator